MSERVKLADAAVLSALADTDYVTIEHNGAMGRYSFADFKSAIISDSERAAMYDNVMILFRDTRNGNYRSLSTLADWPSLQNAGQYAIGVALMLPGHPLVVSVEDPQRLLCASGNLVGVERQTALLKDAMQDMDGEADTAAMIAASSDTGTCDTADYAPGYCTRYSRLDSNGLGIGAGHWWLPSLGEMMAMMANFNALNYALSLVDGASPLGTNFYWTSTIISTSSNWAYRPSNGYIASQVRHTSGREYAVRPVTLVQED